MKFIGIKLSNQEMLNVKGGGPCQLCYCNSIPGLWYGIYNSNEAISDAVDAYCDGDGDCNSSDICYEAQLEE